MRYLPAAYVVAFSNLGLVLAALPSIFMFAERTHWRTRLAAAATISGGIVLIGLAP